MTNRQMRLNICVYGIFIKGNQNTEQNLYNKSVISENVLNVVEKDLKLHFERMNWILEKTDKNDIKTYSILVRLLEIKETILWVFISR